MHLWHDSLPGLGVALKYNWLLKLKADMEIIHSAMDRFIIFLFLWPKSFIELLFEGRGKESVNCKGWNESEWCELQKVNNLY